jgi:6-phosphofructokinase 2
MNPVLEKETSVAGIIPNIKLRCVSPTYRAGGGGINVSRALKKLGAKSLCIYLAGGYTGDHLRQLVSNQGIAQKVISVKGRTRDNLSVTDTVTNLQYRFGVPGPRVKKKEWERILKLLEEHLHKGDYLVSSGKLPPGVPPDFYVMVSKITDEKEAKLVLDTSGKALLPSMKANIFLMKPNLEEFGILSGVESIAAMELESLAMKFLSENTCKILVISLGAKGALLATKKGAEYVPSPVVHQKSTIGTGDSMVAGMVLSLIQGKSLSEMVQYGVACGSAASMRQDTQLCKKEDTDYLYEWMKIHAVKNKKIPKLI